MGRKVTPSEATARSSVEPSLSGDVAFNNSFSYSLSNRTPIISSLLAGCNVRFNELGSDGRGGVHDMSEPVLSPSPVVYHGRLQSRLAVWRRLASPFIVGWIENGVPVEFVSEPVPRERKSVISNVTERLFVREQVTELLQRGCIKLDPLATVTSPIGVVPKKGPVPFRLIHNVRYVNKGCQPKPFKYEKLTDLQNVVKSGDWMVKLDLSAGYHHIPLRPDQTKFFGFKFEGKTYSWQQLFFGLSPAPYFFTMILRDVAKRWRFHGIVLVHYLDDFCIFTGSHSLCLQQRQRVCQDLVDLGFVINVPKSVLEPTQELEFLGYEVNTVGVPTFTVPSVRVSKLLLCLHELAEAGCNPVPVRKVASVAGQVLSMSLALSPARLFTRALYKVVDVVNRGDLPGGWHANVTLSSEALGEIAFWLEGLARWNGCSIVRESGTRVIEVLSDASHLHGWGGWTGNPRSEFTMAIDKSLVRTFNAQGRWSVLEQEEHINLQELRAFLYVAQALTPVIPRGARLKPRLDNTVAVAYLNN